MKTVFNLIKASKEDLNIFNKGFTDLVTSKSKTFLKKNAIMISFILLIAFMFGTYAYLFAEQMAITHSTYIMMLMMSSLAVIVTLFNSVHKSKGVLFDSKDNDLLFSMPITKAKILTSKIIKLIIYQYLWSFLILIPSIIVYIFFEGCSVEFFLSTLVLIMFLPILPTSIGALFGYIITSISSRFKAKNIAYIVFTLLLMIVMMYFSSELGTLIEELGQNGEDIESTITTLYYPLKLYRDCVLKLDLLKLLIFVGINVVPLFVFVWVLSLGYYKIVSKLSENHAKSKFVLKKGKKLKNVTYSLIIKELKRYFKSAIYLTNTIISPAMILVFAIYIYLKGIDFSSMGITEENMVYLKDVVLYLYVTICMFVLSTANTAASSISTEGNCLWIIKSLPINVTRIFISKVVTNCVVMLPLMYIATILISVKFGASIIQIATLIMVVTIIMVFISSAGLLLNLLYPKFSADEIVAVKQSKGAIISVLSGIALAGLFLFFGTKVQGVMSLDNYSLIFVGLLVIFTMAIWHYLLTKGKNKYIKLGE